MADYDLGTARGRIEIDSSQATYGIGKATSATDDFTKSQGAAADKMIKSGAIMVGGAAAIGAGFAVAINAAADFETRISGIAAVSGATEAELESIRKKALQLGADTKFSAAEAAGAMEELIKAGLSTADVMNGAADATVNLAAAGEIDLTSAATIAANAMNAFNLAAEDLPHVADLIAGAANASAIDVNEFAMAMQQSSAVANLAGLSFDDLSVAIAAMGNAGIKGSDAGTSLKTFLSNLQPTTEKQIDLFKELGIVTEDGTNKFYDAEGSLRSLSDISQVLQDSLAGMTDQQKQATLETLFGSDAIRAAAVIADEGADGMNTLADAMGNVSAQEVAETRMDNLSGSVEQLKGSVETLLIIIGRPLADALKVWVDRITSVVNWISALDPETLKLATTVAKMVAAFLGIVGTALIIRGALIKLQLAMKALWLIMSANPVGAIIVGLVALGAALYTLYQNNETFRNAIQSAWEWIKNNVVPIINTVIGVAKQLFNILAFRDFTGGPFAEDSPFIDAVFKFRDAVVAVIGDIVAVAGDIAAFFLDEVVPAMQDFASTASNVAGEAIDGFEAFADWVSDNIWPVLYETGQLFLALAERIGQVIGIIIAIVDKLSPVFTGAFNAIRIVIETFVNIAQILWRKFGDNIMTTISFVFNTMKTIVEAALRIITGVIQLLTGIISGDWSKAWEGIKNIFGGIWDFMKAIPGIALEAIKLIIQNGLDAIGAIFEIAWELIKAGVRLLWETMRTLFGSGFDKVMAFIRSIPGIIGRLATSIWDGFKNGAKSAVDSVVGFFRDLPGRITGLIGSVAGAALSVGRTIIQKLAEGIRGAVSMGLDFAGAVATAVKNVMNGIIRSLNDAFDFTLNGPGPLPDLHVNLPDIPQFHSGGTFKALPGEKEGLALLKDGETVFTNAQMATLRKLLASTSATMAGVLDAARLLTASVQPVSEQVGGGGDVYDLTLNFPNVGSAKDVEEIKVALTSDDVVAELVSALKSGKRG